MEETIKEVGEFGLIDRIAKDLIYRPELVVIGSGDDGAVYRVPSGYDQVISTDTMVEGIHFIKKTMHPSDVGYKLCASNFSDMAAMGAEAIGFVISAALPEDLPVSWVESLYEGIRACCSSYRVNLLGGDVTGSPGGVILTGTVVGMVPKGRAVTRSEARAGDLVFATETLGDSAAGLSALLAGLSEQYPSLCERHQRPRPQIRLGSALREAGATSLNDVSDGLSSEINEIAKASQVEIELFREKIPISAEAAKLGTYLAKDPVDWALTGGEDYELIGTISEENLRKLDSSLPISVIGQAVKAGGGCVYLSDRGKRKKLAAKGYDHFSDE